MRSYGEVQAVCIYGRQRKELIETILLDLGVKGPPAYTESLDGLRPGCGVFYYLFDYVFFYLLEDGGKEVIAFPGEKIWDFFLGIFAAGCATGIEKIGKRIGMQQGILSHGGGIVHHPF